MRVLIVALLALSLAGCSEDETPDAPVEGDEDGEVGGGNVIMEPEPFFVEVQLSGAYPATIAYSPSAISVPAGSNVTVSFTNNDGNPIPNHDWVLEGIDGAATAIIGNGETAEVTFMAPAAGEYTFYCSVPGHRGNGMEGTFTVA